MTALFLVPLVHVVAAAPAPSPSNHAHHGVPTAVFFIGAAVILVVGVALAMARMRGR